MHISRIQYPWRVIASLVQPRAKLYLRTVMGRAWGFPRSIDECLAKEWWEELEGWIGLKAGWNRGNALIFLIANVSFFWWPVIKDEQGINIIIIIIKSHSVYNRSRIYTVCIWVLCVHAGTGLAVFVTTKESNACTMVPLSLLQGSSILELCHIKRKWFPCQSNGNNRQ